MLKTFNTWNKKSQKSFAMSSHQDQEEVVVSFRGVVRQKLICPSPHPLNSFHTFIKARLTGRRDERGGQTLTVILHPSSQCLKFSSHRLFSPRFSKTACNKNTCFSMIPLFFSISTSLFGTFLIGILVSSLNICRRCSLLVCGCQLNTPEEHEYVVELNSQRNGC